MMLEILATPFKTSPEIMALLNKTLLKPFVCPNLVRVGAPNDGGYVVPGDHLAGGAYLVSLGLFDNWTFDAACLAMNPSIRIIAVDHSVGPWWFVRKIIRCLWKIPAYLLLLDRVRLRKYTSKLRNYINYFSFFTPPHLHLKKRVSNGGGALDIRLAEIIERHCPPTGAATHDVVLKMDIEGGEYDTVADIIHYQSRISCITGEFHDLDSRTAEFNRMMEELSRYFRVVHIHGNNCGAYDHANDFPSIVEITFVNAALLASDVAYSNFHYPRTGLDAPNEPTIPEYEIRFE